VPGRRIELQVSEEELARRKATWRAPLAAASRGYGKLYLQHVTQAPLGCDFDFLHHFGHIREPFPLTQAGLR
jgi:dihydroxy-acid dehydratase